MARSSSSSVPLLLGLAALAAVVAAAAWLLLADGGAGDDAGRGGGVSQPRASGEQRAMGLPAPVESAPDASSPRGAQPLEVERPEERFGLPPAGQTLDGEPIVRRVSGTITRLSDGTPVVDALVESREDEARTDAQGHFSLPLVGASEHELTVTLDATPGSLLELDLPQGHLDDQPFVLDTGWLVTGTVLGGQGQPLSDALVSAHVGPSDKSIGHCEVELDGRFALRDVRPSDERVGALQLRASEENHGGVHQRVQLPVNERRIDGVSFVLQEGGMVEGFVVDGAGEVPRTALVVLAFTNDGGWVEDALPGLVASVDDDGRYRVSGVAPGDYVALLTQGPPNPDAKGRWRDLRAGQVGVVVEAGRTTPLDWTMPRPVPVEGRVIHASGEPFVDARVEGLWHLTIPAPGRFGSWTQSVSGGTARSVSDAGGTTHAVLSLLVGMDDREKGAHGAVRPPGSFMLWNLPAGEVLVRAESTPGDGLAAAEQLLQLTPGAPPPPLELVLGAGLSLEGRVFDDQGNPLPDARLLALPRADVFSYQEQDFHPVDASGRFELLGLAPGPHTLLVRCAGHRDALEDVEAGDRSLQIELTAAPALQGLVLDSATGEPVPRFRLRVEDQAMFTEGDVQDDAGRFFLDSLGEGSFTVTITADGYQPEVTTGVVLRRGAPTEVRLLMRR